jgi:two-component system phosphate regulon sensor histidine kinase PhoR
MSSDRGSRRTPPAFRFLVYYAISYTVLIGAMGWFTLQSAESAFTEGFLENLETDARLVQQSMPTDPADIQAWADRMFSVSGHRFTVIEDDGTVIADSHTDPAVMENHADRSEVQAALDGEVGRASRISESTGFEQHYVAIPTDGEVILRVSAPNRELSAAISPVRRSIILSSIFVGLMGIAIVALLASRIASSIAKLTGQTLALAEGVPGMEIRRPSVHELDGLSTAIARLDEVNRRRLLEAGRATATLEVVLGALPEGTILFDETDSVVYANPSAYAVLGAVPDSLSGLAPFPFQTAVRQCREQRSPVSRVVEHGRPVRVLRAVATPFADDERILLVVADVTDRERAASVRRDFVANASHELKTPVSAIIASSEALQIAVERGDESSIRFASQIEASARQLDRLVTDLLDLSRLERDVPDLDPLSLDLLVREELERIRSLAEEREISLTIEVSPVRMAGSRRDVAIAVRNLLDNAIRHTPPGGSIATELGTVKGEAVLSIKDTGEGIPTRDLGRVFERFYRVDNARARATGGTGLGLAIVKHVVESHGGRVEVESELGVGSVFTVHLPVLGEGSTEAQLA